MKSSLNISTERLKELGEQNIVKSSALIAFDWIVILSLAFITNKYFSIPLYILTIMLIANRQHGLLILMHDASHFRFSRNRKVNDIMAELFTAWPLFIRMVAYREKHLAHHKHSNTVLDPDFRAERYPRYRGVVVKMLIRDALALNTLQQLAEIKRLQVETSREYKLARAAFYVLMISAIAYLGIGKEYFMYWIVPAFTWLKVCLRLRSVADHTGLQHREGPFDTRTVVPNLFDKLFLAPHSSSYHFGHHAYAAVPCYNLKKLHEIVMQADDEKQVHVTNGFLNFIREFPVDEKDVETLKRNRHISFTQNMPIATQGS